MRTEPQTAMHRMVPFIVYVCSLHHHQKCPPLPLPFRSCVCSTFYLNQCVVWGSIFSFCLSLSLCLYLRFHHQRARIWQMYILLCTGDTLSPKPHISTHLLYLYFPFVALASCHRGVFHTNTKPSDIYRNGVKPEHTHHTPAPGIAYTMHWYTQTHIDHCDVGLDPTQHRLFVVVVVAQPVPDIKSHFFIMGLPIMPFFAHTHTHARTHSYLQCY